MKGGLVPADSSQDERLGNHHKCCKLGVPTPATFHRLGFLLMRFYNSAVGDGDSCSMKRKPQFDLVRICEASRCKCRDSSSGCRLAALVF